MSMSDCEKCWETPCGCGYDYETWETERIQALRDVLDGLLKLRAGGTPRRLGSWEQPRPKLTAADYQRTIAIDPKDIER